MKNKSFSYRQFLKPKKLETLLTNMKIGYTKAEKENQQSLEEKRQELQNLMIWNSKLKKSSIWQNQTKMRRRNLLELMGIQTPTMFCKIW